MERIAVAPTNDPFPQSSFLTEKKTRGDFPLVEDGVPASILISESDYPGVAKVAGLFQKDLGHVSGQKAQLATGN
ncbi:MAG: hypothetical protein M3Y60_13350, partial [Bacteroidota bacterium]|nr:hypothetical protein [Bacteroidota bacterium]